MMQKGVFIIGLLTVISLLGAAEIETGGSVYAIHDGQGLLSDKDPDAKPVDKLKTHHAYKVLQISGNWIQLKTDAGTGWVYAANLSRDEPPEINTSGFKTEASATTLNAAARGLDDDAKGYASRAGAGGSADDVVWMEKQNDGISTDNVRDYLKEHKLGEYSGGK